MPCRYTESSALEVYEQALLSHTSDSLAPTTASKRAPLYTARSVFIIGFSSFDPPHLTIRYGRGVLSQDVL